MGHARLGTSLPNTRPCGKVVGHIADGTGAADVAQATAVAAGLAAIGTPATAALKGTARDRDPEVEAIAEEALAEWDRNGPLGTG